MTTLTTTTTTQITTEPSFDLGTVDKVMEQLPLMVISLANEDNSFKLRIGSNETLMEDDELRKIVLITSALETMTKITLPRKSANEFGTHVATLFSAKRPAKKDVPHHTYSRKVFGSSGSLEDVQRVLDSGYESSSSLVTYGIALYNDEMYRVRVLAGHAVLTYASQKYGIGLLTKKPKNGLTESSALDIIQKMQQSPLLSAPVGGVNFKTRVQQTVDTCNIWAIQGSYMLKKTDPKTNQVTNQGRVIVADSHGDIFYDPELLNFDGHEEVVGGCKKVVMSKDYQDAMKAEFDSLLRSWIDRQNVQQVTGASQSMTVEAAVRLEDVPSAEVLDIEELLTDI